MKKNTKEKSDRLRFWLRALWSGEKCAVCGKRTTRGQDVICPACAARFASARTAYCFECGSRMTECRCVPPQLREAGVELLVKLAAYEPSKTDNVVSRIVFRLKDRRDTMLSEEVARHLAARLKETARMREEAPENCVVTYIPRGAGKKREKGTDQARLLAASIAAQSGIRAVSAVVRTRQGRPQKTLTFEERAENVRGMFRAEGGEVRGKTVFLVDDVVTSGATMTDAARGLLSAIVARTVIGVCVARTPLR